MANACVHSGLGQDLVSVARCRHTWALVYSFYGRHAPAPVQSPMHGLPMSPDTRELAVPERGWKMTTSAWGRLGLEFGGCLHFSVFQDRIHPRAWGFTGGIEGRLQPSVACDLKIIEKRPQNHCCVKCDKAPHKKCRDISTANAATHKQYSPPTSRASGQGTSQDYHPPHGCSMSTCINLEEGMRILRYTRGEPHIALPAFGGAPRRIPGSDQSFRLVE